MKKKLAIICASYDQIPLVQKAKEMGIETHCFAWEREDKKDDFVCKGIADYFHPISTIEKEKILDVCKEIKIDGVTSIANDHGVATVSFVAQNMGLPGNRYEDSLIAVNKYRQRQAFWENGVGCPKFTLAGENMDLTGFTFPLMVKPPDRCSSVGVMKAENEESLKEVIAQAQQVSYSGQAIVEECLIGHEATVDLISWQGKHYAITVSDTETSGTLYSAKIGYHQPTKLSADIREKIIIEAKKAITALKINYGASDVEVMVTEKGEVKIIEVNPRMGGDCTEELLRLSTGYDFLKGVINLALNQFEEPVFPISKYSGVCYLGKETEYLLPFFENRKKDPDIVYIELKNNELREMRWGADRSGFLIYQSEQRKKWK